MGPATGFGYNGEVKLPRFTVLAVGLFVFALPLGAIDSTWNYAVEITAAVQVSPAQITLNWPQDTNGTPASYTVYRKAPAGSSWGDPVATLSGGTTSFTDSDVVAGTAYEYQIVKDFNAALGYVGYGYIEAGIELPLVDNPGAVVLIVDNTYAATLATELQRLQQDLAGEGWQVIRHDVNRTDSVVSVKNLILADYAANPSQVNTVFLIGHVPVPYSGLINPDGHDEHLGAWPADLYYGVLTGQWTDTTVNYVNTLDTDPVDAARISNVPGDGKFDQSTPPGPVQLQVGRVDLANMPGDLQYEADPSFLPEPELLRQYLNKDHNFRTTALNPQRRALIGDYSGEKEGIAPAAAGFRSFAPITGIGATQLTNLNILYNDQQGVWVPTLQANDYLLALGCGAGSYSSLSGVGLQPPYNSALTTDVVSGDLRASFVMMFGSWFGDWDHPDDMLRSVLATPTYGLVAIYTAVPHWFIHPLGLNETIGYCARLTQNNTNPGLYQNQVNLSANEVHIALMGDPTLRLRMVAPASAVTTQTEASQVTVNWTASKDSAVLGYHLYRAPSANGPFTRLTSSLLAATTYADSTAFNGAVYLVRAVKLEVTPSGSYYNGSDGAFSAAVTNVAAAAPTKLVNLSVQSQVSPGSAGLTAGLVIGGAGTAGSMPGLIRATGPALQAFGVPGTLPDPILTVYQGTAMVGFDDNWGANAAAITAVSAAVGAFTLADPASLDAAISGAYSPGDYSAVVTSGGGGSGTALAEVYDATPAAQASAASPRLTNLSALTQVQSNSGILTVGFVISGPAKENLLLRAVGPGLAGFGISGILAAPQLQVIGSGGVILATNAGWGGDAALASAFVRVGAFALNPTSADSALLVSLAAGSYTIQIAGVGGTTGIVLAELYEVP